MARVTVEDCVKEVPNRFDLVLLSSQRARQISAGSPLTVDRDNDKNPIIALREIASKTVPLDELEENLIQSMQKYIPGDEPEEEFVELLTEEVSVQEEAQQVTQSDEQLALDEEISDDEENNEDVSEDVDTSEEE